MCLCSWLADLGLMPYGPPQPLLVQNFLILMMKQIDQGIGPALLLAAAGSSSNLDAMDSTKGKSETLSWNSIFGSRGVATVVHAPLNWWNF